MSDVLTLAPRVLTDTVAAPPIVLSTIQVGAPITLNATLGHARLWTGQGPPGTIVGAVIGDDYLDTITGNIYRLDPGA